MQDIMQNVENPQGSGKDIEHCSVPLQHSINRIASLESISLMPKSLGDALTFGRAWLGMIPEYIVALLQILWSFPKTFLQFSGRYLGYGPHWYEQWQGFKGCLTWTQVR